MNIFGGDKNKLKYAVIIAVVVVVVVGVLGAATYRRFGSQRDQNGGPSQKTGCDWRPGKDLGLCERILGAYYNGEKCVWVNGCSSGGENIPFTSLTECAAQCK
jgi:hypothetical protein